MFVDVGFVTDTRRGRFCGPALKRTWRSGRDVLGHEIFLRNWQEKTRSASDYGSSKKIGAGFWDVSVGQDFAKENLDDAWGWREGGSETSIVDRSSRAVEKDETVEIWWGVLIVFLLIRFKIVLVQWRNRRIARLISTALNSVIVFFASRETTDRDPVRFCEFRDQKNVFLRKDDREIWYQTSIIF